MSNVQNISKIYTLAECAKAEQDIVGKDNLIAIADLMSGADRLYHDTCKGIGKYIKNPKIIDTVDAWFNEMYATKPKGNAKVVALRRIARWVMLLAEVFEYIENRKVEEGK